MITILLSNKWGDELNKSTGICIFREGELR